MSRNSDEEEYPAWVFQAGEDGRCGICDEPIHKGDAVLEIDDEWVHLRCADKEAE